MRIMYHGTTEENAKSILKDGFLIGTFFGRHLEDALHMGGEYIFEVFFEETLTDYWEYVTGQHLSLSKIKCHYKLNPKLIWDNEECNVTISRRLVEERGDGAIFCETCDGKGQLESYPPFTQMSEKDAITVCTNCNGYGYTK